MISIGDFKFNLPGFHRQFRGRHYQQVGIYSDIYL
jgi:hypothetical protein